MLYSKNGSLPKPQTDGTDGWIEVEDPPVAGDGEEVVWWYPPGWVVRPVKPVKDGSAFDWSQSQQCWTETVLADYIVLPDVQVVDVLGGDDSIQGGV
jgi:hypothetical protein